MLVRIEYYSTSFMGLMKVDFFKKISTFSLKNQYFGQDILTKTVGFRGLELFPVSS